MNSRRLSDCGPQCPEQLHLRMACLLQLQLPVVMFTGESAIRPSPHCQVGKAAGRLTNPGPRPGCRLDAANPGKVGAAYQQRRVQARTWRGIGAYPWQGSWHHHPASAPQANCMGVALDWSCSGPLAVAVWGGPRSEEHT